MTRPELIISSMILIAFAVGLKYGLYYINDQWGLGSLALVVAGMLAVALTAAYVVERRRGNLPDWLRPRDQRRRHPD